MVGVAGESNACYIASIFGQTVNPTTNLAVFVDSHGKLGTTVSSLRFKQRIKSMDKASEAIMALRPVTFQYKTDPKGTPQYGLIAEEVAEVNSALVVRDKEGKPVSVRYDQINAMLLNEFLKEHKRVEEQQGNIARQDATIAELKSTIAQQQTGFQSRLAEQEKHIAALALDLQKVNAQIQMSKTAPKVVSTNP